MNAKKEFLRTNRSLDEVLLSEVATALGRFDPYLTDAWEVLGPLLRAQNEKLAGHDFEIPTAWWEEASGSHFYTVSLIARRDRARPRARKEKIDLVARMLVYFQMRIKGAAVSTDAERELSAFLDEIQGRLRRREPQLILIPSSKTPPSKAFKDEAPGRSSAALAAELRRFRERGMPRFEPLGLFQKPFEAVPAPYYFELHEPPTSDSQPFDTTRTLRNFRLKRTPGGDAFVVVVAVPSVGDTPRSMAVRLSMITAAGADETFLRMTPEDGMTYDPKWRCLTYAAPVHALLFPWDGFLKVTPFMDGHECQTRYWPVVPPF